jgi:hypothetical protein
VTIDLGFDGHDADAPRTLTITPGGVWRQRLDELAPALRRAADGAAPDVSED